MNLVASVHVREGSDALAKVLSKAAQELARGAVTANWVGNARTVYRCQFELHASRRRVPLEDLLEHFARAAGVEATQVVVAASTAAATTVVPNAGATLIDAAFGEPAPVKVEPAEPPPVLLVKKSKRS